MAKQLKNQNEKKVLPMLVVMAAVLVIACIVFVIASRQKDSGESGQKAAKSQQEGKDAGSSGSGSTHADSGEKYYADIVIENYGKITVELDGRSAPITVKNFVSLAKDGFYDGLTFHRIIEGFMMQGGDPEGTGMGGSDKTITGEFASNGYDNKLSHTRGAISMARSNDPDSASSQFFIVHQDSLYLDGDYAVFGYVTEGMEVVDAVCQDAQPLDDNGTIAPDAQPVITSVTIRDAE